MSTTIASLAELKTALDKTKPDDDAELQRILDSIAARISDYTGRSFDPSPPLDDTTGEDTAAAVTRTVMLPRRVLRWHDLPQLLTLQIPDAREITGIVANSAVQFSGFQPVGDPPWRRVQLFGVMAPWQEPVTALPSIDITGRFGIWPAPEDLKDAVLFMAARRWKERDALYGDAVQLAEGGVATYFRQFPPAVQVTIESYRRKVGLK